MISAALTLSACGAKIPTQEQIKETADTAQQKVEEVKEGGKKITGSMKDIMMMGGAMKCTWEDEGGTSGITYIDGEKVNSKIVNMPVGPNGELGDAYTISDGEWLYMWSSLSAQGTKMKMDAEMMEQKDLPEVNVPEDAEMPKDKNDSLNMDAQYNYECDKWNADASMFTPPANITFADMNAMMEQMNSSITGGGDMKQMCNMLTGQDKIDCEAQF